MQPVMRVAMDSAGGQRCHCNKAQSRRDRQRNRTAWLAGAILLGVVIAKLFLVDLSRSGSVERIVSFVGVGVLMLIVGYFSPLPPAREVRA